MSSDLRGMLHGAAKVPSTEADVAGAWRRGRRMRIRRRASSGVAIVAVIALGAVGIANLLPGDNNKTPAGPSSTTLAPAECAAPSRVSDLPSWTTTAIPTGETIPHLVSPDGNVAAVLFGDPLSVGPRNKSNKILWIVRQPRDGQPLTITATLPGSNAKAVHATFPANSAPGEIYPSDVDVSEPGCWHFDLTWNGHRSAINLAYVAVPTPTNTATTAPPATTVTTPPATALPTPPATAAVTTCHTAALGITISGPIGSAGHFNYEIQFRNDLSAACVMTGFPGVSFLDSSGHQIGVPAVRNSLSYAPVTLASGATGYAHLSITDPSVLSGCPATPVAKVRIFPPDETAQALVGGGGITVCTTQPSSTIDPVLNHSVG